MPKYNKFPIIIAATALLIALGDLPYGYYQLLHFLVCGVGIYAAYTASRFNRGSWIWTMGIIALVFNPFFKFNLDKEVWQIINVMSAMIFIISLFIIKPHINK